MIKMKKNIKKRAMEALGWSIVSMTLVLSAALLLLVFVQKNSETAEQSAIDTECRASVLAHSKFNTPINCPVQMVEIKDDTEKRLADLMVGCWDNYGKGELNLFQGTKTFCAFCSVVDFDIDEPVENFDYYLATNSFRRAGERYNYFEYLTGFKPTKEYISSLSPKRLDPDQKYAVVFTYIRESDLNKAEFVLLSTSAFGLAGAVLSYELFESSPIVHRVLDSNWIASVIATPLNSENLQQLGCEELPVELT
jgi:hypothetical protein